MSDPLSQPSPSQPTELTLLVAQIDQHKAERIRMEEALKRILGTHQAALESNAQLQRDIRYLWFEIGALRHGYDTMEALKGYREREGQQLRVSLEHSHQRFEYLESVIQRQQAIINSLEQEARALHQHLEAMTRSPFWKTARKRDPKAFTTVVDFGTKPAIPEPLLEPAGAPAQEPEPEPLVTPFGDCESHNVPARDYHAVLESPQSFHSPAIGQTVRLVGWCCDRDGKRAERMWVLVGEKEQPVATGALRQDVVERMQEQLVVEPRCGFQAEVSTGPGENFIELYARFQDGSETLLFQRIVVNIGLERTPKRQLDEDYKGWVAAFDTPGPRELAAMAEEARCMESPPLFSVLLPVYNTPERWLREVIDSVLGQVYPHWQLCIADDASPSHHVRTILDEYVARDSRIEVVYREKNGHISAATNSALAIANGSFCVLLDHDDRIPARALFEVARELKQCPDADLIFSDEDKIDSEGQRFDPYFKPDWNPDLFLSHNCISHLGVYRTSILKEIGGFQEDLFGSQDWDMALRFLLKTNPDRVRHIPKVLYHWRYLDSSTSKSIDSKPYAVTAGKKAIENYLHETGRNASVMEGMWPGAFRVLHHLERQVKVSIIIPTRDQVEVTRQCIESILGKTEYPHYEILVVDNESVKAETQSYLGQLRTNSKARVLPYPYPFNFSAINNFAAKEALGEVLLFLNNDVEVLEPGWLEELVSQAMRPEIGAVGGWLLFPDHTVQHAGILLGVCGLAVEAFKFQLEWNIGHMGRAHLNQYYSAVTGACLATRKEVFTTLGGFEAENLGVAYNDIDYCLRAQRDLGLATTWTPYAKLLHHESVSRGYENSPEKQQRFARESAFFESRWADRISNDPYYNPNLTLNDPRFSLAWPPRAESKGFK